MIPLGKDSHSYLEQILNILTEESKSACIWLSLDKKILYSNDSAAQIFGWSEEVVGKNFSLFCREQEIEDVSLKYLPEEDFNSPVTGKISELKLKNYPVTIIQWDFFPIKNADDKTTSILMIGIDIRKNLQDKNTYLYNIMNNVPHTIFWKNRESVFLGCNEAFAKSAQLKSPEDIVGLTDYDLPWKKSESDAYRADDKTVMESDQPRLNIEETQTLSDGTSIILLTSKVPLHDKNGYVNGVLGVYADITAQKNIENQLAKAKAKEVENELKRTTYLLEGAKLISASIAHEIRTPLATIKSTIWNIERTLPQLISACQAETKVNSVIDQKMEDIKKGFNLINKKVDQSNTVINMLLMKLQSINFEFSGFDVCVASDCVQDALNEFTAPDQLTGKIYFNKNNDFKFLGNQTLVMHVIMNLLKNAIFYILKARKGEVTLWLENHSDRNEIHFKDTGTGIKKQILSHIFDSFFTTSSSTGTGIGLAFSKMVMQSHRGDIHCTSQEGEYTEFILSFPILDK